MSKVEGGEGPVDPPPLLKASWNYFFFEASRVNTKTLPLMHVTMITFLCPFLPESPRLNVKLL